jgi:hypothetical protein
MWIDWQPRSAVSIWAWWPQSQPQPQPVLMDQVTLAQLGPTSESVRVGVGGALIGRGSHGVFVGAADDEVEADVRRWRAERETELLANEAELRKLLLARAALKPASQ